MAEFNNLLDQQKVLQRQDLTPTEKLVAIVLLSFRNAETGRCNPPIVSKNKEKETVCTRTGFSDVCVQKAIRSLESKKVFQVTRELGMPSFFIFGGTNEVSTGTNVVTPNEVSRGANHVKGGTNEVSTGVLTRLVHNKELTNKEQISNKEDGGETLTPPTSENDCCESKKQNNRGTSFNLETLPDDWKDAAEKLAPDLDPEKLFEEFTDYWRAVPGERGRKKDWLATFRNHIRNLPDWKRKNFRKTNGYREPETREPDFSKIDYGESGLLSDFKF